MSNLEFQISTSAFLAAQRNALRSLQICPPPPSAQGILIDKLEFGNNAIRHNVEEEFTVLFDSLTSTLPGRNTDGFQTQLAQEVTVFVTTLQDVLAHPNQPPATIIQVHGTLVFNLAFVPNVEECFFQTQFQTLELGPLPALPPNSPVTVAQLLSTAEAFLRASIPSRSVPAGLAKFTTLFSSFVNAGISVDTQLQRIALRAQIGGNNEGSFSRWQQFFKGDFPDSLQGADWSFYIDAGLINEFVKAKINQLLDEADIDHLQTFVGCNYSSEGGKAVFTLNVEGIYDLPDPLATIYRNVHLPMEISVAGPNTLRLSADYGEVLALIHSFEMIEFLLPSLSNGIEGIIQIAIDSALTDVNKSDVAPYCKKVSSTRAECTKSVQLPQIAGGTSALLTKIVTLESGFAVAGSMRSTNLLPTSINTFIREFKFNAPAISCSVASVALVAAFQENAASARVLHARAVVNNLGATPIYLCRWSILKDTLGAFLPGEIRVDAGPAAIEFSLDFHPPSAAYFDLPLPYPCDLLVTTTAGTRLLRVQPPPRITQADIDKMVAQMLVKVGDCEKLTVPWFEEYKPGWGLVEVETGTPFEHLWHVTMTGLDPGQEISLVGSSQQELVRATARANTPLLISALVAPSALNELTVVRQGASHVGSQVLKASSPGKANRPYENYKSRGIEVGQYQIAMLGAIPLNEECQSIQAATVLGDACVLAVLRDGIKAYDLSNPRRPLQMRSWTIPGIRGVFTWQGALLYFGEGGFGWIYANGQQRPALSQCCSKPIVDAAAAGASLYAITDEVLQIYSAGFCKLGAVAAPEATCVSRTAGKLVVAGRKGLSVHDITDAARPKCGPSLCDIDVQKVARPLGSEAGTILASLYDGSALLLNIAGTEIHKTAAFAKAPWFVGGLKLDDLLIRIGGNGRSVDINRFAASTIV
jgi:hypothetical protein